ncbi:MAG: MAB_1171c family putative transporter [Nakamurella sp.]
MIITAGWLIVVLAAITATVRFRLALLRHRPGDWALVWAAAAMCVAFLFRVLDQQIRSMIPIPSLPYLMFHLGLMVVGASATVITVTSRNTVTSRSAINTRIAVAVVALATFTGLFWAAPKVPTAYSINFMNQGTTLAVLAVVFALYASACAADIGWLCWRAAPSAPNHWARAGLLSITAGCLVAIIAGLWSSTSGVLNAISPDLILPDGGVLNILAAALIMFGLIASPTIGLVVRYAHARAAARRLHPLWVTLTEYQPGVVLPANLPFGPVARAEITAMRYRVEISDALLNVELLDGASTEITRSANPMHEAGSVLSDLNNWRPRDGASNDLNDWTRKTGTALDIDAIADGFAAASGKSGS